MYAQRAALFVGGEGNRTTGRAMSKQDADGCFGVRCFVRLRFRGGECSTGAGRLVPLVPGTARLPARFIARRLALSAVAVPVRPLAPAARGSLVAPFFIRVGSRTFWICGFAAVAVRADGEGVHRTGISLQFATHVARFRIA
eukprot:2796160-Pleurochrysis_carterae.AAC.1